MPAKVAARDNKQSSRQRDHDAGHGSLVRGDRPWVGGSSFVWSLGLGIDESYTVATGRHPQLSYFDHPPLAWWLAWAGAHFFGTEAPLAVRAPFILLFAATTWLMFSLTRLLFGERAGL